jgi:predicted helicase
MAADFWAFAHAGMKLIRLHTEYEKVDPHQLRWLESDGIPISYRVDDKMRLDRSKTKLCVNPSLTLADIPMEAYDYRLGNRSALEWVIDQYQVAEDKQTGLRSDPNRPDDEQYIVRLVGQVLHVSVETVRIVRGLSKQYGP